MTTLRAMFNKYREECLAAVGLLFLYLAVMNGHLVSIDGLVMWRQALSIGYQHSLQFSPPIWWAGGFIYTSTRGIAASIQYLPGLVLSPIAHAYQPTASTADDFGLLYRDRLYAVAGAPVWVLATATTALLVGALTRILGFGRAASLWAIAFYGIGSPALLGARGDFPQPLVALCWAAGILAALRMRYGGSHRWMWLCAGSIAYGVLSRPLEGSFLLPAVLVLLGSDWRARPWRLAIPALAWMAAVVVSLLVNDSRFGSPMNFGYPPASWTLPIWVGFPYAFLSPGRGAFWQFPAMLLAIPGTALVWRAGRRVEAFVLAGLPIFLFLESCTYYAWIDGWDWGFRLFQPALPLIAVLAGIGTLRFGGQISRWLPAALLAVGALWNVPAVATDLLGGYGATYDNLASWSRLDAYPPIGAWQFLHHIRATAADDSAAVDIVWFRLARVTHWLSLIPFLALIAAAAAFWSKALHLTADEVANRISPR
jgi:hypothetical protein